MNTPATREFIALNEAILSSDVSMVYHRIEANDLHPTTPGKGDTPGNGIPVYTPSPLRPQEHGVTPTMSTPEGDTTNQPKRALSSPESDYDNIRWQRKKARQYQVTTPSHSSAKADIKRAKNTPTGSTPDPKRWEAHPPIDKTTVRRLNSAALLIAPQAGQIFWRPQTKHVPQV
jgi:hypothetical protein